MDFTIWTISFSKSGMLFRGKPNPYPHCLEKNQNSLPVSNWVRDHTIGYVSEYAANESVYVIAQLNKNIGGEINYDQLHATVKTGVENGFDGTQLLGAANLAKKGRAASNCDDFKGMYVGKFGDMPSPRPEGMQVHHGVMSAWMKNKFKNYNKNKAPAILIYNHEKTFGVYNKWRARMRTKMNGRFDWNKVSLIEMKSLSNDLFDAASVPKQLREQYWQEFDKMYNKLSGS